MPLEHRPDNDVIADDKALDTWHKTFTQDQARKAGRRGDPKLGIFGEAEDVKLPEFGG